MDKETHDHYQKVISDMMMTPQNPTKSRIEEHRECIIAAQWAEFNYGINSYRNKQRGLIKKDPYHFWITTEKHRLVLMAVCVNYYRGIPLIIKTVAHDLGFSDKTVSNILAAARKLGLLETVDDCKFKPSEDTIDGYVHYTNQAMKLHSMQRLAASIFRDVVGSFSDPTSTLPHENRVDLWR
tara:strand:- start:1240 stop:1785 length:546 start_codon:yes stop_codon:yes gene_type:complete